MGITEWWASGAAMSHMLDDHAVEWQEVEDILSQKPPFRRALTVRGEKRYVIHGQTRETDDA